MSDRTPTLLKPRLPVVEVVELLEDVLARAKRGEVDGVFILHTGPCRQIGQGSAGNVNPADMIYNLELWKFRYFRKDETK